MVYIGINMTFMIVERFKDWFAWKFLNPYKLEMPFGQCPVQIEGTLKTGEHYYFRARVDNS